ncbi:MAG: DUF3810 domain-containing protein [Clostridia bacterium]|nr:DUF3810 domain-containing protein [Clostridia bacterium]
MSVNIKGKIKRNVSLPAKIVFVIFIAALAAHIISAVSEPFADFFNRNISSLLRGFLAKLTNWLPFSLGEALVISLPVIIISVFALCMKLIGKDEVSGNRTVVNLFAVVLLMYSIFAISFGVAYNTSTLDKKLGLDRKEVTAQEIYYTATVVQNEIEKDIDDVRFTAGGSSVMPYSINELSRKINEAYKKVYDKYTFISPLNSNIKCIALSDLLTYTHISGLYTYYTGEANLNLNFPEYVLPYTVAHELAHQRGIAREEEANFVAFLVCMESDDPYIRYSAYQNVYEYLLGAMSEADSDLYDKLIVGLNTKMRGEMVAYNRFFEKYRNSTASKVSGAVNDMYLKSQGEKHGAKSYNLVVDLAVAYYAQYEDIY